MATKKKNNKNNKISAQILDKVTTLVMAAFGFVAALAWNEAVKTTFQQFYGEAGSLIGQYSYAIFVTIIAVTVTIWLSKLKPK